MLKDLVARLRLDTTQFKSGLRGMEADLRARGVAMREIGMNMSMAITAPIIGAVAAVDRAARDLDGLAKQAQMANMSAQEFKILAMASDDFGIAQDKLADILKDVNERIGEFQQTGSGPMKDFFENIAPKVGLTADAFRDLSGADALQLYISSLQQAGVDQAGMTFYMEALAGDASKLLPVFRDNGKALKETAKRAKELGLALDDDLIANAQKVWSEFGDVKDVLGLQFQQTMIQIAPVIQDLMTAVMPVVRDMAEGLSDLAKSFQSLSPDVKSTIVGMVGLAAVAGPALVAFGALTGGIGVVAGGLASLAGLAMAHPLLATIAAVAAGAALIYSNWDSIAAWFGNLWSGVTNFMSSAWEAIKSGAAAAWDGIKNVLLNYTPHGLIYQNWGAISQWFADKWQAVKSAFSTGIDLVKVALLNYTPHGLIYQNWTGISEWFASALASLPQVFADAWEQVKAITAQWAADFMAIGGQIVDGLKAGITEKWDALVAWFSSEGDNLTEDFKENYDINSPSRVFRAIGQFIVDGLKMGLQDRIPQAKAAMSGVADAVNGDDLTDGMFKFRDAARSVFQQVAFEGKKLGDVLKSMAANWLSNAASNLFTSGFNGLWSGLGLPTFAKGGVFMGGQVAAFANGGVVSAPTHFPMRGGLGLMGEAGPEAILPLRRGAGGRLGVEMNGRGGGRVEIVVRQEPGATVEIVRNEVGAALKVAGPGIVRESVKASAAASRATKGTMGI